MNALEEWSLLLVGRVVAVLQAGDGSDAGGGGGAKKPGSDGYMGAIQQSMVRSMMLALRTLFRQVSFFTIYRHISCES